MDAETVKLLIHTASVLVGVLVSSWRITARLKRIEQAIVPLPALAVQVETHEVRLNILDDLGPVLR